MKEEEPNREQQTPLDDEEQIAEAVELSYGMRLAGDRAEPSAKTERVPPANRSLARTGAHRGQEAAEWWRHLRSATIPDIRACLRKRRTSRLPRSSACSPSLLSFRLQPEFFGGFLGPAILLPHPICAGANSLFPFGSIDRAALGLSTYFHPGQMVHLVALPLGPPCQLAVDDLARTLGGFFGMALTHHALLQFSCELICRAAALSSADRSRKVPKAADVHAVERTRTAPARHR